jgi:hypothetical protein
MAFGDRLSAFGPLKPTADGHLEFQHFIVPEVLV